MGTIRYQRLSNHVHKTVGKPYAGKSHVRNERGMGKEGRGADSAPLITCAGCL